MARFRLTVEFEADDDEDAQQQADAALDLIDEVYNETVELIDEGEEADA
jgi:hypothetical protein